MRECVVRGDEAQEEDCRRASRIKPSKISEIVSGANRDPQFSTVEKLAKGFNVSVDVFLAGPRPLEAVHGDRTRERSAVLDQLLREIDIEAPADDSWRGDVLKALAALTRALRRADTRAVTGEAAKARR